MYWYLYFSRTTVCYDKEREGTKAERVVGAAVIRLLWLVWACRNEEEQPASSNVRQSCAWLFSWGGLDVNDADTRVVGDP